MTSRDLLDRALVRLAEHGQRPRCGEWQDGNPWLSEDHDERRQAARWCVGCPLLDLCTAVAVDERPTFGVYGGQDFTKSTRASRQMEGGDPLGPSAVGPAGHLTSPSSHSLSRNVPDGTRTPRAKDATS